MVHKKEQKQSEQKARHKYEQTHVHNNQKNQRADMQLCFSLFLICISYQLIVIYLSMIGMLQKIMLQLVICSSHFSIQHS